MGPGRLDDATSPCDGEHGRPDLDVVDVLVVGAGPTGLTLALELAHFGVRCRIVDAGPDGSRQSRAMAIQPRTLEVLGPLGVTEQLVRRGNPTAHLHVHAGRRVVRTALFDIGVPDTAHPFLLFLSQAVTEQVLLERLTAHGVAVERSTTLAGLQEDDGGLVCTVRHGDGTTGAFRARYAVGCDGASSTVRRLRGIPFVGGTYPQTFVLADLGVDGLEAAPMTEPTEPTQPASVHAYLTSWGPLLFFPLREPAPWRLIAARPPAGPTTAREAPPATPVSLAELQALSDRATDGALTLRDPVWLSAFTIQHRMVSAYRRGRVFVAGDAAHVHSPVGAQGMNTGIQDAVNLGWKLALVLRGDARPQLLDSYDAERRPVAAFVLRMTDRGFVLATSRHPVAAAVRTSVLPRVLPMLLRLSWPRRLAFRTVSQLGIRYRTGSAVQRSTGLRGRRRGRVRPGDRLPDGPVVRDGRPGRLHDALRAPAYHLLLCGPADSWDDGSVEALTARFHGLLDVHRVDRSPGPGTVLVPDGALLRRLGASRPTQLLVRPDGHVCLRADDPRLTSAATYLTGVLTPGGTVAPPSSASGAGMPTAARSVL